MTEQTALRKRQQIASAGRMMFIWVAIASVIIGAAAVVSVFLFQKLMFNERVLAEKGNTVKVLRDGNEAAPKLKENVRVLNTNTLLIDNRANSDDEPAQVVLDALPAVGNAAALGSSLESNKLLGGSGLTIDSLDVTPVEGSEDVESDSESSDTNISFSFTVSADQLNVLREALRRLERSIRIIDVTSLTVDAQGDGYSMSVEGEGYYEPARVVELKTKEVK